MINGTTKQKIETVKRIISEKNTKILPEILVALDDPSTDVRILASEALLKLGDSSFITSYQKELNDTNWQVRLNGIKGLIQWGTGDEIMFDLKRALDDSYWQVRYWAAVGIGKFGDDTMLEPVLSHLKDENFQVRAELFWALRKILGSDQVRYAFKKLPDSTISIISQSAKVEDARVQVNAIWAMEATDDKRVVPGLLDFLNNPSDDVKIQAVWALENMKTNEGFEFLRAKLLEPSIKLKVETIKSLVRLDDQEGIPAIIGKLDDPDENVRIFALWALKEFADFVSFPSIVKKLADSSEKVRNYAYNIILELKSPDFIPVLEDDLVNPAFPVNTRVTMVDLLGRIAPPEESLFFDSVKNNPEPSLRKAILSAWYRTNPDDTAFLMYLNFASHLEPDVSVRTNAQRILKNILAGIKNGLESNDTIKRNQSIEKLSFFKESVFVTPLIKGMFYSKYQDIRVAALELLNYQPKAAVFTVMKEMLFNESDDIKKLAMLGMGKAHITQAIPLLTAQLKKEDPEMQSYAAYALAMLGNADGLKIAIRDIKNSDIQIQSMAVESIALLNASVAIPDLLRILENSELEVKLKASWALCRLGEEKGLYTLVNLSRQDIEPLRTQARRYLADKKIPVVLRTKIPEIQKKQEMLLTGVPEVALKKLVAMKTQEPPVVDGNPNDRIWRSLTEDRTMVYVIGEKVPSEVQTSVMVTFDDEKIYLLFNCLDTDASSLTFDSNDFLTICINPLSSESRWYQYTIQATGFLKFAYVWKKYTTDDNDTEWQSQWIATTRITNSGWIAEIMIPFSDFGTIKPDTSKWEINFQRVSDHLPAVTWTGKIDNPAQFGHLIFKTTGR
ncbi:MAG TPA: HEAT repeat domain-containing protein [bacterium]|nr:HEAT repeat domain-containing protein [bacterium]HPO52194.1 HEAT repeat domain-containing protein [bacterium]